MNKSILFAMTFLFFISCNNYDLKIVRWHELSPANNPIDSILKKEIIFDKNDNILSEKIFNPELRIHLKCIYYDSLGRVLVDTTFIDSLMTIYETNCYKYKNNYITERKFKQIRKENVKREMVINYENSYDSINRILHSKIRNEFNVPSNIETSYDIRNNITSRISKQFEKTISKETYLYDDAGKLIENYIEYPQNETSRKVLYYYDDTLLSKSIFIQNLDTFRLEQYIYDKYGVENEILIEEKSSIWYGKYWKYKLIKDVSFVKQE